MNESYICFRRREVKAVRKTRASQANSSDKLAALNRQLYEPLEIAKSIIKREYTKCQLGQLGLNVWQRRIAFVDLKRRNPSLDSDTLNEELLVDKEPPAKKPDLLVLDYITFCSLNEFISFSSRTRIPVKPEVLIPLTPYPYGTVHSSQRQVCRNTREGRECLAEEKGKRSSMGRQY